MTSAAPTYSLGVGTFLGLTGKRLRDLIAGPEQAAGNGAPAHTQRLGGLTVGEADDIDGQEHVAELAGSASIATKTSRVCAATAGPG